ncbi:MAG: hypothetical protein N2505_05425, partial [Endomicrobia bacterium]|nr:hypothetical protein [Endomicrobiia bacterium]
GMGGGMGGDDLGLGGATGPNVAVTTYSDVGKIWIVKEVNKIISNLLQLNLLLVDVNIKFVKYYEDLSKVQEIMSLVLFNYDKYKDRFDAILALVKLFLIEYFKEMLKEIEHKVKDEKLKRKIKLLILRLEEKFYKKVKKETKKMEKKEQSSEKTQKEEGKEKGEKKEEGKEKGEKKEEGKSEKKSNKKEAIDINLPQF